jgi:hypothetical protein
MTIKIICPKRKLPLMIEAIDNPLVYMRIKEEASREISYDSLRISFPDLSEEKIKGLYELALGEHAQYTGADSLLKGYVSAEVASSEDANRILKDISSVLAEHVQACRRRGKCFGRFMLWAERKARAEMIE